MTSSDSSLLSFFSGFAVVGCVAVIIGALFEGAELIVKLGEKRKARKWVREIFGSHRRRGLVICTKYLKPKILPFEAMGFVILMIGLAFLCRSTKLTHLCSDKLTHPVWRERGFSFQGVGRGC